ncbi:MAG TPA: efflux RND transporter periplasmic adaptor subunit [Wenzhouxiangellaceae bacterium]|nr:efflux RND transporter periplasmic adaptor subunit [Wenzhouxiangellaceae bacterium]
MKNPSGGKRRFILIWASLFVGVVIAALLVLNRQTPTHGDERTAARELRVVVAERVPFRFEARGHGVSRAAQYWQATANVPGRVVERHTDLESGAMVREGELLVALDPSRYRLAIAEAEAQAASLSAELERLDKEEQNTARLLELERERLALSEQELSRIERLVEQGSISQSRRDQQVRATVAQRKAVAVLENELALVPALRNRLHAELDRAETRLGQAAEDLADTRFVAPYDLRINEVDIELHQQVTAGQKLFRGDSIEAAEIEAHIPLPMLRRLMGSVLRADAAESEVMDISERLDFTAIKAEARLAELAEIRWPARVTRVASGLDPKTRSVRVVVTVDRPYENVSPPAHPALQPGMYLQVRLSAPAPENLLVVPAAAVHDNELYIATPDDRLERREVSVAFRQSDLAVIGEGLSPGERVIVDDPVPALDGMPIQPSRDEAMEEWMRTSARGRKQ